MSTDLCYISLESKMLIDLIDLTIFKIKSHFSAFTISFCICSIQSVLPFTSFSLKNSFFRIIYYKHYALLQLHNCTGQQLPPEDTRAHRQTDGKTN